MTDIKQIALKDISKWEDIGSVVKDIIDKTPDHVLSPHCAECGKIVIYDYHWLEVDVEDEKVIFCIACGIVNNEYIEKEGSGFKIWEKVKSIISRMRGFK